MKLSLFANLAVGLLLAGCLEEPTYREQQINYAKYVAGGRVEVCLDGVTYYSFSYAISVVAVSPKYDKLGKIVLCDGAD